MKRETSRSENPRGSFKGIIFGVIIFVLIIQSYFLFRSIKVYEGIHMVESMFFLCIYQSWIWYKLLFKERLLKYKYFGCTVLLVIAVTAVPLVIYMTKPEITYEEGKSLIIAKQKDYDNYDFIPYKRGKNTIPVRNNPERYMVRNRTYYYRLTDGTDFIYFVVNPIDKEVHKMSEGYWVEDK